MEKYRPLIDDWEEFRKACSKPAVTTVRKNRIKSGENFRERLERDFGNVEGADWNSNIYRLQDTSHPGKSMLHWLGEYYVQEESAAIPVDVLDPGRGEKILDMCAAPGGKTTQIASRIENTGKVVANDSSGKRLQGLHANIYRTGAGCVNVANYDGRNIPENGKFDSILLDAPCSGEGDRARRGFEPADKKHVESLSELQKQLAEKAARLLAEGGEMVYSTCTIDPLENEEVVESVIENTGLTLENIELECGHSRGVKSFEDKQFTGEMEKTTRVYPHHLNSGVIYVARFRK